MHEGGCFTFRVCYPTDHYLAGVFYYLQLNSDLEHNCPFELFGIIGELPYS